MSLTIPPRQGAHRIVWRGFHAVMQAWLAAGRKRRQRRVTRELVSSSPYLLRDIGLTEDRLARRDR